MKRITLPTLILLTALQFAGAQQYPYFTQYTLNKFVSNPAAAGIDGYTSLNFIAREQWVGHGGTPKTHALIIDSRILGDSYILRKIPIRKNEKPKTRSGNTAWGAFLINDINGPISKTYINGTYAYHLDLGEKQLSFGLSMLLFQNRLKADQFVLSDNANPNDPLLISQSYWIVDANFGAYLTGRDYYAGYSTVQLFNSSVRFGIDGKGEYRLARQHNLIGGYRFFMNNRMDVEPSMLFKLQENMTAQMDLSAKFIFEKTYWGGVNLRTGKAFSIFGGMKYLNYYFGYAFEYNFNSFAKLTFATHELTVIARFGDAARRYKWLNSY